MSDLPAAPPATRRPPALLLLLKGHPGTGKSSLARRLAIALRCPLVDKDDVRDCFEHVLRQQAPSSAAASGAAAAAPPQPAPPAPSAAGASSSGLAEAGSLPHHAHQQQQQQQSADGGVDWNALSYRVMFRVAATQLSLGLSVVVDCPLARATLFEQAQALAAMHDATPVVVECAPSDEAVWRARLEARAAAPAARADQAHKPQDWAAMQALLQQYDGCWRWTTDGSAALPHHYCTVDTSTLTADAACRQVLTWLAARGLLLLLQTGGVSPGAQEDAGRP